MTVQDGLKKKTSSGHRLVSGGPLAAKDVGSVSSMPVRTTSLYYRSSLIASKGEQSQSVLKSRWTPSIIEAVYSAITQRKKFPEFVEFIDVEFANVSTKLVDLRGIDFCRRTFEEVDLSYCALDFSNLDRCRFERTHLQYSRICGASLRDAHCMQLQASPIDAAGANLSNTVFRDCFFQGSSFLGAKHKGSRFIDCVTSGSDGLPQSVLETTSIGLTLEKAALGLRRQLVGKVISDKRAKTVTVLVERRVKHELYDKIVQKSSRYHAHDESNQYKMGDIVEIVEGRPISKSKTWVVSRLIQKASLV